MPPPPHSRQHRADRYDRAFQIGAYQPQDLFDRLHLPAGTVSGVHTGIHKQQVYRMLGIKGVDPASERDLVGHVDRAGYAARTSAGTE